MLTTPMSPIGFAVHDACATTTARAWPSGLQATLHPAIAVTFAAGASEYSPGGASTTWNEPPPMFDSSATCLPSGENAPAITPCWGRVVLVTTLPCPQSVACPE